MIKKLLLLSLSVPFSLTASALPAFLFADTAHLERTAEQLAFELANLEKMIAGVKEDSKISSYDINDSMAVELPIALQQINRRKYSAFVVSQFVATIGKYFDFCNLSPMMLQHVRKIIRLFIREIDYSDPLTKDAIQHLILKSEIDDPALLQLITEELAKIPDLIITVQGRAGKPFFLTGYDGSGAPSGYMLLLTDGFNDFETVRIGESKYLLYRKQVGIYGEDGLLRPVQNTIFKEMKTYYVLDSPDENIVQYIAPAIYQLRSQFFAKEISAQPICEQLKQFVLQSGACKEDVAAGLNTIEDLPPELLDLIADYANGLPAIIAQRILAIKDADETFSQRQQIHAQRMAKRKMMPDEEKE